MFARGGTGQPCWNGNRFVGGGYTWNWFTLEVAHGHHKYSSILPCRDQILSVWGNNYFCDLTMMKINSAHRNPEVSRCCRKHLKLTLFSTNQNVIKRVGLRTWTQKCYLRELFQRFEVWVFSIVSVRCLNIIIIIVYSAHGMLVIRANS